MRRYCSESKPAVTLSTVVAADCVAGKLFEFSVAFMPDLTGSHHITTNEGSSLAFQVDLS